MKKKSIIFSNCLHHKKNYDRVLALQESGFDVQIVGYDWMHGVNNDTKKNINYENIIKLWRVDIGFLIGRIINLFLNIFRVRFFSISKKNINYDLVLCNSFEMLLIFFMSGIRTKRIIFDLADLNPFQYKFGFITKMLNKLESYFSARGVVYVVTSPWFYYEYIYKTINKNAKCFLIENFIISEPNLDKKNIDINYNPRNKITILWNGILRCNDSLIFLKGMLISNKSIKLILAGNLNLLNKNLLNSILAMENVEYKGEYSEDNLYDLYSGCDWIWAADLNDDLNAKLLLPNRVYQAIHGGLPSISIGDNAISKFINEFNVGVAFNNINANELVENLLEFSVLRYNILIENISKYKDDVVRKKEWINFLENQVGVELDEGLKPEKLLLKRS